MYCVYCLYIEYVCIYIYTRVYIYIFVLYLDNMCIYIYVSNYIYTYCIYIYSIYIQYNGVLRDVLGFMTCNGPTQI